jgi:hypothetical protein
MKLSQQIKQASEYDEMYRKLENQYGHELSKNKYIGSGRAHDCDRNSYKMRKDYKVFKGSILFFDPSYKDFRTANHIFNVDDQNKVVEFTDLYPLDWNNIHYFGREYKKSLKEIWKQASDYKPLEYLLTLPPMSKIELIGEDGYSRTLTGEKGLYNYPHDYSQLTLKELIPRLPDQNYKFEIEFEPQEEKSNIFEDIRIIKKILERNPRPNIEKN